MCKREKERGRKESDISKIGHMKERVERERERGE